MEICISFLNLWVGFTNVSSTEYSEGSCLMSIGRKFQSLGIATRKDGLLINLEQGFCGPCNSSADGSSQMGECGGGHLACKGACSCPALTRLLSRNPQG